MMTFWLQQKICTAADKEDKTAESEYVDKESPIPSFGVTVSRS
jgi:hypothetical protein